MMPSFCVLAVALLVVGVANAAWQPSAWVTANCNINGAVPTKIAEQHNSPSAGFVPFCNDEDMAEATECCFIFTQNPPNPDPDKNKRVQVVPDGEDYAGDEGAHIIAARFNGRSSSDNAMWLTRYVNGVAMKKWENQVSFCLRGYLLKPTKATPARPWPAGYRVAIYLKRTLDDDLRPDEVRLKVLSTDAQWCPDKDSYAAFKNPIPQAKQTKFVDDIAKVGQVQACNLPFLEANGIPDATDRAVIATLLPTLENKLYMDCALQKITILARVPAFRVKCCVAILPGPLVEIDPTAAEWIYSHCPNNDKGIDKKPGDEEGHILASALAGVNCIFALEATLNTAEYADLENIISKFHKDNKDGRSVLTWHFSYDSPNLRRPDRFTVDFTGVRLPPAGPQPGAKAQDGPIVINYNFDFFASRRQKSFPANSIHAGRATTKLHKEEYGAPQKKAQAAATPASPSGPQKALSFGKKPKAQPPPPQASPARRQAKSQAPPPPVGVPTIVRAFHAEFKNTPLPDTTLADDDPTDVGGGDNGGGGAAATGDGN